MSEDALAKGDIAKLRALISCETFEYSYKNHSCKLIRKLTEEEFADWKRRIDEVCH